MSAPKPINLLIVTDLFPEPGNPYKGVFVLDYIRSVADYCKITVLHIMQAGKKKGLATSEADGYRLIRYTAGEESAKGILEKASRYLALSKLGRKVVKLIDQPDLIHSHGSVIAGSVSLSLGKLWKRPYIITEHTNPFSKISGSTPLLYLSKRAMESSAAVLPVSMDLANQIKGAGIHPPKIEVSFNPVDTNLFPLRPAGVHHRFLFVGRLEGYKGALRVLKALDKIANEFPEWQYVIVGDGPERADIEAWLAANPAVAEKVSLTGALTKSRIREELHRSDFFVFPSEHETFGITIAEALSCGLPVITANTTAPPEFVDKESGLLVAPNDVQQISEAMQHMMLHHADYEPAILRQKVVDRFGFDNFGQRMKAIYEQAITCAE